MLKLKIIHLMISNYFVFAAAFQHVRDNMDEINYHVKAKETDIIFLKTLMDNSTMESLIKVSKNIKFIFIS